MSALATLTSVAASTSSVQLVAANNTRVGLKFHNDSPYNCRVKLGNNASSTSYSFIMEPGDYYEWTGADMFKNIITAVWEGASGFMRVTEEI